MSLILHVFLRFFEVRNLKDCGCFVFFHVCNASNRRFYDRLGLVAREPTASWRQLGMIRSRASQAWKGGCFGHAKKH